MGALGLGLGLPFTQARSGGAAVTLSSLLAEAGAADWDISVAASLKQNSDGTTAVASTDPIGYIADQTGHGLHLVQATAGKRMTLSNRSGVPMVQSDCVDDCYDLPVALAAAGGTFAFASAHGEPQCYWVAQRDQLPHAQFGRACWFPRALSSDERTAVLAGLGAIFSTTHQFEALDTSFLLSAYFANANLYTSLDDASALGATVSVNLQTSTDVGPFPPWETSGYYSEVTTIAREWVDITTTAADIESVEVNYWGNAHHFFGRAFDPATMPSLKVWAHSHAFEGQFPPVVDWPDNVEYVSLSGPGASTAQLTGAHATGAQLATRPSLRALFWETDTDGAMPSMAGLPALQSFGFGRRQPWTLESGWAVPSTVKFCTFGNQVGTTAASVVNAILAAFRAAAVTGCTINLQTGMAAPSGQGLTDKQWLIDHGANTVNTN